MTEAPAGKGRPTPKRSEKVKRTGPVAPPPLTRKEAAQRQKEQAKAARATMRSGAISGDERFLPKRDAGPVRKLVRDVVDSRRNAAVLLLPVALVLVLAQVAGNRRVLDVALTIWLAGLLTVALDTALLCGTLLRRIKRDHPQQKTVGHIAYGVLRSTVFRRWRMPAPAVPRGTKV